MGKTFILKILKKEGKLKKKNMEMKTIQTKKELKKHV